jgi:methylenetetrahydrofolate dehydrogenase (NADP+)/methenyltetrahydrofolate cyclohydrolase
MSATIIDGKAFAAGLRARIADGVTAFRVKAGRAPGLAVVLVGEDPASNVYVRSKGRATREAGMESIEHRLPADVSAEDLLALVDDRRYPRPAAPAETYRRADGDRGDRPRQGR